MDKAFTEAYKALNTAQKQAVDTTDGPVMVVAGPGTGKTQVLALRIANILTQTDTPASGILCLTFTNSGVRAMRERLLRLMGARGSEVHVSTFHRFAIGLIEKNYELLDFAVVPTLLGDTETVALVDEILETYEWTSLRPRGDSSKYFGDLKSVMSLLRRENISPDAFLIEIERDIERLSTDPDNISSRGPSKGKLKKEAEKKIESLGRTREVVRFYELYEQLKRERSLMDYDDVLLYAVQLAQESEDVRATIRENYLYVLVDEHQDSSGVQNAFLEAVWGDTEKPNIFVVGDDRQLIYGFGGASLEHFTKFSSTFGKAKIITLIENYRSTQVILDAAASLIQSSMAEGALHSQGKKDAALIQIAECDYPRDEILLAAASIKKAIASGIVPEEIAILVPKNFQVKSTVTVLRDAGIPVAALGSVSFFSLSEALTIRRILSVLADPYNTVALGQLLLDPVFGIPPLEAHAFLRDTNTRKMSLETLIGRGATLLGLDPIARLGVQLKEWLTCASSMGLSALVQKIGDELFFTNPTDHSALVRAVEVVRTFMHLSLAQDEKGHGPQELTSFLAYLDRLEQYGHPIPLAVFSAEAGVKVLTLHASKGLEFRYVYIAHIDDASLMRGKRGGFALPERIDMLVQEKNELAARRELYVAITRAKERCAISYARHSYTGAELVPARILADLPAELVEHKTAQETEALLLAEGPEVFVQHAEQAPMTTRAELATVVAEEYSRMNVSVTLLNNFFECPWKWYFRNLLQLPEPKTESLLVGSAVHTGIEYILKHRDDISATDLEAVVVRCLEKEASCDDAQKKRVLRETEKILAQFQENYLPRIEVAAQSERSLSYKDPKHAHLTMYGKIDLTEHLDDETMRVTDFKTGGTKSKSVIEKLNDEGRMSGLMRQLAMYSFLIQGASKQAVVSGSRLLFIEAKKGDTDAVYTTHIGADEIALLKKDIADYDQLVQSGGWTERPCDTKLYGSNDECEYCAMAKRLYV